MYFYVVARILERGTILYYEGYSCAFCSSKDSAALYQSLGQAISAEEYILSLQSKENPPEGELKVIGITLK